MAILPMMTAVVGVLTLRQSPSVSCWCASLLGSGLVLAGDLLGAGPDGPFSDRTCIVVGCEARSAGTALGLAVALTLGRRMPIARVSG